MSDYFVNHRLDWFVRFYVQKNHLTERVSRHCPALQIID
jgi:hypothetical protein